MSKYDDLVTKLKEIFQIDKPELDFGIYRILNARVVEINDYLENRLKAKVAESLAVSGAANLEGLQKELNDKEAQYSADGIDPDTVPKIQEIRQKLAAYNVTSSEHENAVFTHLLTFFSRYYDKGDFISQRRYKGDTYAIPYSGEEVVLHWANKDQYYTKSGENFSNYAFKLDDGRSVRFRLVAADTAKDNRKDNDKERRFVLIEPPDPLALSHELDEWSKGDEGEAYQEQLEPVAEENGELVLRFEYKAMPKGSKQDDLVAQAAKTILKALSPQGRGLGEGKQDWYTALTQREPTEKNPQRTLLEKALTNYTAKNSADYFIHKDLGGFLRRELDFYIKNEVMNLDDVQHAEKFADIEHNLRMIQTLRAIALDLITFLAQLEDFQLKLWLKKKFVVAAHYCITLDRIIKDAPQLLDAIAANPKQWTQWETLGMLEAVPPSPFQAMLEAVPPSPLRGEGRGEGQKANHQIKTRSKAERSEIIQTFAKEMRQAPTDAEARLWFFLRNRRLGGFKFRRQHAIDRYIVDFISVDARLVVELDGGQHGDIFARENDAERSEFLAARGLRVLRFWNNEVLQQTEAVLERILSALDESITPHPNPLPAGEREQEDALLEPQPELAATSGNKALSPAGRGLDEGAAIAYLQQHPYLMVDSALFDASFKQSLLAAIHDLDDSLDGLLVHGDNFQALNLLQERYREQVKCIYIDPPYNTDGDGFCYKDNYQSSSWCSMMFDRLSQSKQLIREDGTITSAIGREELLHLLELKDEVFGLNNRIADLVWEKGRKNDAKYFSLGHDYMLVYGKCTDLLKAQDTAWREEKPGSDEILAEYNRLKKIHEDDYPTIQAGIREFYQSLDKDHPALKHRRYNRVDCNGLWRDDNISWPGGNGPKYDVIHPETGLPCKVPDSGWRFANPAKFQLYLDHHFIEFRADHTDPPMLKRYLNYVPMDFDPEVKRRSTDAEEDSANVQVMPSVFYKGQQPTVVALRNLMGADVFRNPKESSIIARLFHYMGTNSSLFLDYFAGSGTTGHAVIALNRQDKGCRKYILVEQGDYFDTVLKPRIQKVVYSADWKDGKATAPHTGISHAFKVLKIESYEDALNNLELRRTRQQLDLLESLPQTAQEDYLLRYMLNIESRGSLLSIEQFGKPFAFKLKVAVDSAGAYEERPIDLVETFNYLIGLRVKHIDMQIDKGFALITGLLPSGDKALVLWRDVEQVDYEALNRLCDKLAINPADSEYAVIYINGDHNIPAVFTSLENEGGITKNLKIRQIEPEFLSRMFAVETV